GIVIYGDSFTQKRPQVAQRVMKAYIRGVRYYLDQLVGGKIEGANAEEIIDILARYSGVKDKRILRAVVPVAFDPDGRLSEGSLKQDLDFFREQELVKGSITIDQLIDNSWVEAALRELGPYKVK